MTAASGSLESFVTVTPASLSSASVSESESRRTALFSEMSCDETATLERAVTLPITRKPPVESANSTRTATERPLRTSNSDDIPAE